MGSLVARRLNLLSELFLSCFVLQFAGTVRLFFLCSVLLSNILSPIGTPKKRWCFDPHSSRHPSPRDGASPYVLARMLFRRTPPGAQC